MEKNERYAYTTGFNNIDFIGDGIEKNLSPIIPDGSMMIISGRDDCDTRALAVQIANNIIKDYVSSCIFHYDYGYRDDLVRDKIMYFESLSDLSLYDLYKKIRKTHAIKLRIQSEIEYDTHLYDKDGDELYKIEPTVFVINGEILQPKDDENNLFYAKERNGIFARVLRLCKEANIILILTTVIKDVEDISPLMSALQYDDIAKSLQGSSLMYMADTILRLEKVGDQYIVEFVKCIMRDLSFKYLLKYEDNMFKDK